MEVRGWGISPLTHSWLNRIVLQYCDLSLPTPYHDLAGDEALLELCEAGYESELLRFWEPRSYSVVLGYTNKLHDEARVAQCEADNIPVLRRASGGGTVLQGPGCLNYSLVLKISDPGPTAGITETNASIMQRHRQAIESLAQTSVAIRGVTDLTLGDLKFSGNAQRRKRGFLLFHGTFLLDFDIPAVARYLKLPARQPEYRHQRAHEDFLTNLHLPAEATKDALKNCWGAAELFEAWPFQRIEALVEEKYLSHEWTFKF